MTASASSYRVSLRLYVVFSLLMAVSAAASGLLLLYLARPFIAALGTQGAQATALLFTGAGIAGALAAVAGLLVGLSFAGRIRGIVQKAEALSPPRRDGSPQMVTDELGALDAAVGRLTLSMDQLMPVATPPMSLNGWMPMSRCMALPRASQPTASMAASKPRKSVMRFRYQTMSRTLRKLSVSACAKLRAKSSR